MKPLGALLLLSLSACAAGGMGIGPRPTSANSHPGFDTARFPGEAALRAWRITSPYEWVGYYLPAPCHRDSSWAGTRALIQRIGWGTAVIYAGQQAFEPQPGDTLPPTGPIVCSRSLLTPERGQADGQDAIARAAAEGFPSGSTVFLDVELVRTVPDSLLAYYRAWTETLLRDGRYLPGTYVHQANATALYDVARDAYQAEGRSEQPPFWVAGGRGFSLQQPPWAIGLPFVTLWQGVTDVDRTWGGVTLRIDENVATRADPSAPHTGAAADLAS